MQHYLFHISTFSVTSHNRKYYDRPTGQQQLPQIITDHLVAWSRVTSCNEIRFSSRSEGNCIALPSAAQNGNSMQRVGKSIDFSIARMYYCRLTRMAFTLTVIASVPISGYSSMHYTRNIGQVSYTLQYIYYNTTYNIWTSIHYNPINNNTKFKGQLEVESVTTSRYMCTYVCIYVFSLYSFCSV